MKLRARMVLIHLVVVGLVAMGMVLIVELSVDDLTGVHEGVIAASAAHLYREDPLVCLDRHTVEPVPGVAEDLLDPRRVDLREVMPVDDHDRPQGASSEAVHGAEAELSVRRGLT